MRIIPIKTWRVDVANCSRNRPSLAIAPPNRFDMPHTPPKIVRIATRAQTSLFDPACAVAIAVYVVTSPLAPSLPIVHCWL